VGHLGNYHVFQGPGATFGFAILRQQPVQVALDTGKYGAELDPFEEIPPALFRLRGGLADRPRPLLFGQLQRGFQ